MPDLSDACQMGSLRNTGRGTWRKADITKRMGLPAAMAPVVYRRPMTTDRRPSAAERRVLENVHDGRPALHGFAATKGGSVVLGAVVEAGWLAHTMKTTGPAFMVTPEGAAALARE